MESDMDEDMEDTFEGGFEVLNTEIDFDYEYDASKFFDFCREESYQETREAESWFFTAPNYPPSPFVLKLSLGQNAACMENVNISPKPKQAVDTDMEMEPTTTSRLDGDCKGLTFYNHMAQDTRLPKSKHCAKSSLLKGSTLMKPTASQLAKQNRKDVHSSTRLLERSQASHLHPNQKSLEIPAVQAAKRQKLEGGHLPKIVDTKPQTSFVHKTSKMGGPVDGNSVHTKLKLTIPRQPDLSTAHRAQRIRPKNNTAPSEEVKTTAPMFRARPLNRKMFEAPSLPLAKKSTPRLPAFQEFHLKTSERAMQHSSAASSASVNSNKADKGVDNTQASSNIQSGSVYLTRSNFVETPKQTGCETNHNFKARPLNKKIFSSKGDIGVFRNTKREDTTPMEYKLSTDKKSQFPPPVDLFDKLSLASEQKQKIESQPKLPWSGSTKVSKENAVNTFQQQQRQTHVLNEKSQKLGGKQLQCGIDGDIKGGYSRTNTSEPHDKSLISNEDSGYYIDEPKELLHQMKGIGSLCQRNKELGHSLTWKEAYMYLDESMEEFFQL